MKEITKTYTKDDLVVKWEPAKCIHSATCFHGLEAVFDPRRKPWIDTDGAPKGANSSPNPAISVGGIVACQLSYQKDEKVLFSHARSLSDLT